MVWRIITTVVLLGAWSATSLVSNIFTTLASGQLAGRQFDNSDLSYAFSTLGVSATHGVGTIIGAIVLFLLSLLWWGPVKRVFIAACAVIILLVIGSPHAEAYWDQTDRTEAYFILPNESAFLIPDVGANKDSQAAFGSEEYLKQNKIAAKRVTIPHAKLTGSTWVGFDYYAPTARLIIVDRTPFSREWVAQAHRGTSQKDESFPCQSKEGLDISVGIAIGAEVYETDAPKFLYHFGVKSPGGDRSKPEVIFTSVFYGRSLGEVMDGPIRSKVQSLVCNEFTKRTFDEGNSQAAAVMTSIEGSVGSYLTGVGITMDYIGWADTFTFAHNIQDVINRVYVADKEAKIAAQMASHTQTLQALAVAEATRTVAGKWDGKAPSSVSLWWLPSGISDFLTKMLGPSKP